MAWVINYLEKSKLWQQYRIYNRHTENSKYALMSLLSPVFPTLENNINLWDKMIIGTPSRIDSYLSITQA